MPELPVRKPKSFESAISVSPLSIYIGRIVYMPSAWKENGLVYVDVNDISGEIKKGTHGDDEGEELMKELENFGYRKAMLPRSFVMAANLWENPQAIYYKGSFAGSGSISISNYMFDPLTMTWITTVSTALNAIGIVNVPPVFVSLSETGLPSPPSSVDVGQLVDETFSDALNGMTEPLEPGNNEDSLIPSIEASDLISKVKEKIMDGIGDALKNGGGALTEMLSGGVETVSSVLPSLKKMYGYDEIIEKRDVLKQALTEAESTIVRKITELERSANAQANALLAKASASIEQAKKVISDVIIGIVSPIVTKLVGMYNDVINGLRDRILNVVNTKLKPPIQKIKKKLVRIVSMAITPVLEKLPMPARYIATIVIKNVLKPLIKKCIGFVVDAVKACLKKAFDFGKDKIIDFILKAFDSLKDIVMNSFAGRIAKQVKSKTEWIMTTDLGTAIQSLPSVIAPMLADMDTVYEQASSTLSPSSPDMFNAVGMFTELLHSTYDGASVITEGGEMYYDGILGRSVSLYSSGGGYAGYASVLKLYIPWLQKKLLPLKVYAESLGNPTKKPSVVFEETWEDVSGGLILETSERDYVTKELMSLITGKLSSAMECSRGLDGNIFGYICDLLGIDRNTLVFEENPRFHISHPSIKTDNEWFPKWEHDSYNHIVHTSTSTHYVVTTIMTCAELGCSFKDMDDLVLGAQQAVANYINDFLASIQALVFGSPDVEQNEDGTWRHVPITDRNGRVVYRYSKDLVSFIHVDEDTGYVYQICPAFSIRPREYAFNANKKKENRIDQKTLSNTCNAIPITSLASKTYYEAHKNENTMLIPVDAKQVDLLNRWYVFMFDPKALVSVGKDLPTTEVFVFIELCDAENENDTQALHGLKFYVWVNDHKRYLVGSELIAVFANTPIISGTNGVLSAEGLTYIFPQVNDTKTLSNEASPILIRKCEPYGEKDKHGNITQYLYRQPHVSTVYDNDGKPKKDAQGNTVYVTTYNETLVDVKDVSVMCKSVVWYEDELSEGVDMSAFFYVSPAIYPDKNSIYPVGTFLEELQSTKDNPYKTRNDLEFGNAYFLRYFDDTTKKDNPITFGHKLECVSRKSCDEIVFITMNAKSDKVTDTAQLHNNDVSNKIVPRDSYRDALVVMLEKESELTGNDSMQTDTRTGEDTTSSILDNDDEWYRSWDGIMGKVNEAKQSVSDKLPDVLSTALNEVDFKHLSGIEPLLSDAQQKVMDRMVNFMEDVSIDVDDFSSEFTDTLKQMMSGVGELASKAVDVTSLMEKVSTSLSVVEKANKVLKTISDLGDVAQTMTDTFDSMSGSLDTSLVSSLGSMIGPSMSISSSIGEYDMNLTEKPKCMKPYCYELDDNSILKVGDIVLMMAVGNSTDHLYIIELPYKGQIV